MKDKFKKYCEERNIVLFPWQKEFANDFLGISSNKQYVKMQSRANGKKFLIGVLNGFLKCASTRKGKSVLLNPFLPDPYKKMSKCQEEMRKKFIEGSWDIPE